MLAGSLVLLALVIGFIGTTYGLFRANYFAEEQRLAKIEAETQTELALKAAAAEKSANDQSKTRLRQIEKGNEVLTSIFADLDIRRVNEGTEKLQVVLAKRLVQAANQLEEESVGDPLVVARLQFRLGTSLLALGFAQDALHLLQKALVTQADRLGEDNLETTITMSTLADIYNDNGQLEMDLPLYKKALELQQTNCGVNHPETLLSMSKLARSYHAAGQLDLVLPLYKETLKRMKEVYLPEHSETISCMGNLAVGYHDAGRLDLALPLYEKTVRLNKAVLGAGHTDTLSRMTNLAGGYKVDGQVDRSLQLLEEVLALRKANQGDDFPGTLLAKSLLANGYLDAGRVDLGVSLCEATLKQMEVKLGSDHPFTFDCRETLAHGYRLAGKLELALPLMEDLAKQLKTKFGPDYPQLRKNRNALATCYWSANQLDKSSPLFEESAKFEEEKLGRRHPDTLLIFANLGINYKDAGRISDALPLLLETNQASKLDSNLRFVGIHLLDGYVKAGMPQEAKRIATELQADARVNLPWDSPQLARELSNIGDALLRLEQFGEAEPLLREALEIYNAKEPEVWTTFQTHSLLGGCLLGQKKFAEAEPLLLAGYLGMEQRKDNLAPRNLIRIPESIERLIELYTAIEKPVDAAKWQQILDKYKAASAEYTPNSDEAPMRLYPAKALMMAPEWPM